MKWFTSDLHFAHPFAADPPQLRDGHLIDFAPHSIQDAPVLRLGFVLPHRPFPPDGDEFVSDERQVRWG